MSSTRASSPFSRSAVIGIVVIGFLAFVAMLYFMSVGDTGGSEDNGEAHAAANGLTGYSGLARLLDAEGFDVVLSREESGLETAGLLVITPSDFADAEELTRLLQRRAYAGPTLVIVPKWMTSGFPPNLPEEQADKIKEGWVQLNGAQTPDWLGELEQPFTVAAKVEINRGTAPQWAGEAAGLGGTGRLPQPLIAGARESSGKQVLVSDSKGRALAVTFDNQDEFGSRRNTQPVTIIIEPDLVNNMGLADGARAALALRLIEQSGVGEGDVTFDLTLNGLGGTVNLLTLAFRPPFLAATLCLLLAMLIVGWRAFRRFGPPIASGPDIAFGKSQLVTNGAGLILRARRLRLLADPYAHLSARRLANLLGLAKSDPEAIDAAIQRRLPQEEPFSRRANRLREATSPSEILRAAQALKELEGKLSQ